MRRTCWQTSRVCSTSVARVTASGAETVTATVEVFVPASGCVQVTVTLTVKDGRTYLEALTEMKDRAGRDAIIESGMEGGMQESYNALEKVARSLA